MFINNILNYPGQEIWFSLGAQPSLVHTDKCAEGPEPYLEGGHSTSHTSPSLSSPETGHTWFGY